MGTTRWFYREIFPRIFAKGPKPPKAPLTGPNGGMEPPKALGAFFPLTTGPALGIPITGAIINPKPSPTDPAR